MSSREGGPDVQWFMTTHALRRCREMDMSVEEVVNALRTATRTYPGGPNHGDGRRIACGGSLAVVYVPSEHVIITVLWDGAEGRAA